MLIRIARSSDVPEITDESLYLRRREFLRQGALGLGVAAGSLWLPACGDAEEKPAPGAKPSEEITPFEDATSYNNFYELGTDKGDPKRNAGKLRVRPWSEMKRMTVDRTGVFLSPFAGRHWLEAYRGMRLLFETERGGARREKGAAAAEGGPPKAGGGGNRDQVVAFVETRLGRGSAGS